MSPVTIDKSRFDKTLQLVALNIPVKTCSDLLKRLKDFLFMKPKTKRVYHASDTRRLLLLNEDISTLDIEGFPTELKNLIQSTKETITTGSIVRFIVRPCLYKPQRPFSLEFFSLELGYSHLSVDEALRVLLPSTVHDVPSSYEQIGHIAHLNLREVGTSSH